MYSPSTDSAQGIRLYSIAMIAADPARTTAELAALVGKLSCVEKAKEG